MTPNHTRSPIAALVLAAGLMLSLLAVGQASAAPSPRAATKACATPKYPGEGYFTLLTVKGVSCDSGKKLAIAYYKCRVRNGGKKGKCPTSTKVNGFSCKEDKRNTIPTEINARVTCKSGTKTIVHTYQQNT